MDDGYLARFRERSEYEAQRTAPPDGFPVMPDIPLGRYTDPQFYALEMEHVFARTWLYAAHDSELPDVGSYKLIDAAGAPILLVRGEDRVVRAFFNACRHRGAPVVKHDSGTAKTLICAYHSWGYDLMGELVRVPDERDFVGLERSERGLPPVRCEQWGGWWFINRDANAEPLLDFLNPLPHVLGDIARSPVRIIDVKSVEIRCNWKILAEGFLEVYHARTVHATTVAASVDTRGTVIDLFRNGHQNMLSPVRSGSRNDRREELGTLEHLPAVFREWIQPAHGIFPNLITPLDRHGYPFLVFWPMAIDRTRLDIIWFAPDWGNAEQPGVEQWEARLKRFDQVMDEDYFNLEPIQRSMENAAHGGQAINYQERRIWHVHAWIDKTIGVERVPAHLHVPDLLADWVTTF